MKPVGPIHTRDLFPTERQALLDLLASLSDDDWNHDTICDGWSVKDIAAHLLGDDMGLLSGRRDGYRAADTVGVNFDDWGELIGFINRRNAEWVTATRRLSPRVLIDLLRITGQQTQAIFESLDVNATGSMVNWASAAPVPVWMELAREYTERWTHQQHIRDAVNRPGLKDHATFGPVLDAFIRALPRTYAAVDAPDGTQIACTISGDADDAGGQWLLHRESGAWALYTLDAADPPPANRITLDQETAWRLFTHGINPQTAQSQSDLIGDQALCRVFFDTVSMLV